MKRYVINEIFGPTIQGEGARTGTVNYWIRFAACNQTCKVETHGFDCDTDFSGGRPMTWEDITGELRRLEGLTPGRATRASVVLSGGEPCLQVQPEDELVGVLREAGYYVALETNGSLPVDPRIDWVTVSPKTAEHTLRACEAAAHINELKYVRAVGQALPKPRYREVDHFCVSPAFEADGTLKRETLEWCIHLCKENPQWQLSLQLHKLIGVR